MQTITIQRGDKSWTEWSRCLGGWRKTHRDLCGIGWTSSRFVPSDDAEALAEALSQ